MTVTGPAKLFVVDVDASVNGSLLSHGLLCLVDQRQDSRIVVMRLEEEIFVRLDIGGDNVAVWQCLRRWE